MREAAFRRRYAESSSRYTVYLLYPPVFSVRRSDSVYKTVHYAVETSELYESSGVLLFNRLGLIWKVDPQDYQGWLLGNHVVNMGRHRYY